MVLRLVAMAAAVAMTIGTGMLVVAPSTMPRKLLPTIVAPTATT